eukprot:TRINITY_DN15854_c0_g1_i1.p2 TRINITY_DN15854_c0_g1~~TRINITY_DN15854_c0_g1_i1.p2  ORF type:complete len:103 (-),score=4.58 TRINITY_DN15854_c0_g1_i1:8-316(-)
MSARNIGGAREIRKLCREKEKRSTQKLCSNNSPRGSVISVLVVFGSVIEAQVEPRNTVPVSIHPDCATRLQLRSDCRAHRGPEGRDLPGRTLAEERGQADIH